MGVEIDVVEIEPQATQIERKEEDSLTRIAREAFERSNPGIEDCLQFAQGIYKDLGKLAEAAPKVWSEGTYGHRIDGLTVAPPQADYNLNQVTMSIVFRSDYVDYSVLPKVNIFIKPVGRSGRVDFSVTEGACHQTPLARYFAKWRTYTTSRNVNPATAQENILESVMVFIRERGGNVVLARLLENLERQNAGQALPLDRKP